jgi:uncharacterized membrane protein
MKSSPFHALKANFWPQAGLILALVFPSSYVVAKFLGLAGIVAYFAFVAIVVVAGHRWLLVRGGWDLTGRWFWLLAGVLFLFITVLFLIGYPLANSGLFGQGSDRDDALNVAVNELLQGRYPYHPQTYLNNPISPMPGALLLAGPFVLLGNAAYQNIFWLFALLLTMARYLRGDGLALLMLCSILLLSPTVMHELVTGGDMLANSIYLLLFVIWVVSVIPRPEVPGWGKLLLAGLLGVGLASRANFALILPLVYASLAQTLGFRAASRYLWITGLVSLLLVLPFYLYDPAGFSPLHTADKLGRFAGILPHADLVIPLLALVLSLLLGLQGGNGRLAPLLRNCALVLAVPVLAATLLESLLKGRPDLAFASYGISFLFFGVAAFWLGLWRPGDVRRFPEIEVPSGSAGS